MSKQTTLYPWHVDHGAKMVEFGGYLMPVSYQGVLAEHQAVRERCGLFDISHMGEIYVTGPQALALVQRLTSNDVLKLADHEAQYSLLMHPEGYALDDLLVYRLQEDRFLLCVNAANAEKDFEWIQSQKIPGTVLENASESTGMIALQGPNSPKVLEKLGVDLFSIKRFSTQNTSVAGVEVLLSRTGYTGEEGCEFFCNADQALSLWEALWHAGESFGIMPVGLGARDTLRLEMGYVLYGHELSPDISPLEANLSWVIKLDGDDFLGRDVLLAQRAQGVSRRLVGLKMEASGIPREGMAVSVGSQVVGKVLSGTMSPTLKQGIATALVEKTLLSSDSEIFVDIRGKMKKAKISKPPFIQRS